MRFNRVQCIPKNSMFCMDFRPVSLAIGLYFFENNISWVTTINVERLDTNDNKLKTNMKTINPRQEKMITNSY